MPRRRARLPLALATPATSEQSILSDSFGTVFHALAHQLLYNASTEFWDELRSCDDQSWSELDVWSGEFGHSIQSIRDVLANDDLRERLCRNKKIKATAQMRAFGEVGAAMCRGTTRGHLIDYLIQMKAGDWPGEPTPHVLRAFTGLAWRKGALFCAEGEIEPASRQRFLEMSLLHPAGMEIGWKSRNLAPITPGGGAEYSVYRVIADSSVDEQVLVSGLLSTATKALQQDPNYNGVEHLVAGAQAASDGDTALAASLISTGTFWQFNRYGHLTPDNLRAFHSVLDADSDHFRVEWAEYLLSTITDAARSR